MNERNKRMVAVFTHTDGVNAAEPNSPFAGGGGRDFAQ